MSDNYEHSKTRRRPLLMALLLLLAGLAACDEDLAAVGDVCGKNDECSSGRCEDQICKAANPFGIGDLCKSHYECRSENCLAGVCAPGQRTDGQPCNTWEQCAAGKCEKGVCVGDGGSDGGGDSAGDGPSDAGVEAPIADIFPFDFKPEGPLDRCELWALKQGLSNCKALADQTITSTVDLTPGCYHYNKLVIDSAGTLKLQTDAVSKQPTTIIAEEVVIEQGAVVHSDSQGYAAKSGPGRGEGRAGGGHGGEGAGGGGSPGGSTYGDKNYPILAGSGGGGGAGGGAIRICATNKITINGTIRVRGKGSSSGGGSGGSILIYSAIIEGNGTLEASGGSGAGPICGASGGSGGGGRIGLRYGMADNFSGTTNVDGKTVCGGSSQPGTVAKGPWTGSP